MDTHTKHSKGNPLRCCLFIIVVLALLLIVSFICVGYLAHKLYYDKTSDFKIPEVYFSPNVKKSSLIAFEQGYGDTYEKYMATITKDIQDSGYGPGKPGTMVSLGDECVERKHYGYDEGRPCVLLSIEKILNWTTKPLCNNTVPENVRPHLRSGYMTVLCEGAVAPDMDNIGPMDYWPRGGFDLSRLPYKGQSDYVPPLVMVQFQRLVSGMAVGVKCTIWSDDIRHQTSTEKGSVSFIIMID